MWLFAKSPNNAPAFANPLRVIQKRARPKPAPPSISVANGSIVILGYFDEVIRITQNGEKTEAVKVPGDDDVTNGAVN
jgi:hypothetical protein